MFSQLFVTHSVVYPGVGSEAVSRAAKADTRLCLNIQLAPAVGFDTLSYRY